MDTNYLIPRVRLALAAADPADASAVVERYYGPVSASEALSPMLLNAFQARAEVALLRGDGAAAVAIARRAIDATDASPIARYLKMHRIRFLREQAQGHLLLHDPAAALPLLESALTTESAIVDPAAPDLAIYEAALGSAYLDQGDSAAAQAHLRKAQSILRAHNLLGEWYLRPVRSLAARLSARR
jgi:hypothetical protein